MKRHSGLQLGQPVPPSHVSSGSTAFYGVNFSNSHLLRSAVFSQSF